MQCYLRVKLLFHLKSNTTNEHHIKSPIQATGSKGKTCCSYIEVQTKEISEEEYDRLSEIDFHPGAVKPVGETIIIMSTKIC